MKMNDFFSNTVDNGLIDSTISAFNNMTYDITDKQRTKWRKNKAKDKRTKPSTLEHPSNHKTESRFIPIRDENKFDQQQTYHNQDNADLPSSNHNDSNSTQPTNNDYKSCLKSSLLPSSSSQPTDTDSTTTSNEKVLSFKTKAPLAEDGYINNLRVLYTVNSAPQSKKKNKNVRYIAKTAERVLDAPDLMDDYYLNLLHWGAPNNMIAIGLGSSVYLWNSSNGEINLLTDYNPRNDSDTYVCSVRWNHNSQYIAVGTSDNIVTLYDAASMKALRKLHGHSSRIGALSWNHSILSSGSADSSIRNNDVRQKKYVISIFNGHEQEICGLTWNNNVNGRYLASGSNDNKCSVWEMRVNASTNGNNNALHEFTESLSAVKALAYCPWNSNLLATGGGSGDRKIRIYNMSTGGLCGSVDAQSQVTSLIWNPFEKELLSSHGFSKNQLSIWKYPALQKTHDLTGHNARVLHTTLSPNGQIVCSAAADETLRFWNVFQSQPVTQRSVNGYNQNQNKNKLNLRIR